MNPAASWEVGRWLWSIGAHPEEHSCYDWDFEVDEETVKIAFDRIEADFERTIMAIGLAGMA